MGQQGGPLIQVFINDLTKFEQDLGVHVVEAERVLTEAGKISVGSSEAYTKGGHPTLTLSDLDSELTRIVEDITQADKRLPKLLKSMRKRMKKELPKLAEKNQVKNEIHKLAHMMAAMKNGIFDVIKELRSNFDKLPIDALNSVYWDSLGLDVQRYMGTMRDLDKEELQFKQNKEAGGGTNNLDMPSMKLSGVLGTTGVTNLNTADNLPSSGSYVSRATASSGMGPGGGSASAPMGTMPTGMPSLNPSAAVLPKLQVRNMEL